MSDEIGVLERAILEEPHRDSLRLRLAELLERQGDLRGEFIRVQVELSHLPEEAERFPALKRREMELLLKHGALWAGLPLHQHAGYCVGSPCFDGGELWEFARGFPERVLTFPHELVTLEGSALAEFPVRQVFLHGLCRPQEVGDDYEGLGDDLVEEVAACAHLHRVRELWLECCLLGDPGTQTLAASSHLTGLKKLELSLRFQSGAVGESLASNPALASLEHLGLLYGDDLTWSGDFGMVGSQALAASPHLSRLRHLTLMRGRIPAEGLRALLDSPCLAELRELEVSGNPVGAEGMEVLASSAGVARLTRLHVDGDGASDQYDEWDNVDPRYRIGTEGARILSQSPYVTGLASLSLSWNELRSEGLAALSRSLYLGNLGHLDVSANEIGPEGAISLAASERLRGLTKLDLDYNDLGDEGVMALARSENLSGLRSLHLRRNQITDRGLVALAQSPFIRGLCTLSLDGNRFTGAGLQALLNSPNAAQLRRLSAYAEGDGQQDEGCVMAIASSPHLTNLVELRLEWQRVTEEAATQLVASPYLGSLVMLQALVHEFPEVVRILRSRWGCSVGYGLHYGPISDLDE